MRRMVGFPGSPSRHKRPRRAGSSPRRTVRGCFPSSCCTGLHRPCRTRPADPVPGRGGPERREASAPGRDRTLARGAALGPRSIRVDRTTTGTSGHPTRRSAWPLAGRSIARSSLTTTRSSGSCRAPCGRLPPRLVVAKHRPRLHARWCRSRKVCAPFVLDGRATRVPHRAANPGIAP
jgi:hypothetical protein